MRKILTVLLVAIMFVVATRVWSDRRTLVNNASNGHTVQTAFDKSRNSLSAASSIWVIVNKTRPINPSSYIPEDLRTPDVPLRTGKDTDEMKLRNDAADALEKLFAAADRAGQKLMLASGYRSYAYQSGLYGTYVRTQGKAAADTQSARPGYSEHQTGLAADIEPASRNCEVDECFASTPEGKWLAANAYAYGFVIRYPKDGISETGYVYEPWHVRYVGVLLSREIHRRGDPTLETFFGLPAAPNYR